MLISIMGIVYRLTPTAWHKYLCARARGEYPEPGKGWRVVGEPLNVTDMDTEEFEELLKEEKPG